MPDTSVITWGTARLQSRFHFLLRFHFVFYRIAYRPFAIFNRLTSHIFSTESVLNIFYSSSFLKNFTSGVIFIDFDSSVSTCYERSSNVWPLRTQDDYSRRLWSYTTYFVWFAFPSMSPICCEQILLSNKIYFWQFYQNKNAKNNRLFLFDAACAH